MVILDASAEPIAAFAGLHPDGIVGLHVFGDNITSVGYHAVHQIHHEAVRAAYLGQCVEKGDIYASAAATKLNLSDHKLLQADLTKARTLINYI